jgi:hypothetical protein
VSRLRGDLPEYGLLSRRDGRCCAVASRSASCIASGPFGSLVDARAFLEAAFGAIGREVAAAMSRPRLSYNVAVYHRTVGATA